MLGKPLQAAMNVVLNDRRWSRWGAVDNLRVGGGRAAWGSCVVIGGVCRRA
jgi:hypothetical protein